jgi:hypothetical protein
MSEQIVLHQATERYLAALRNQGKSERTLYTYGKDFEQIEAYFGPDRNLTSILLSQVGKFYRSDALLKLPDGRTRADKTIDKTKRVFRMFMVWALENGLIECLPLPKNTPMGRDTKPLV